MSDRTPKLAGLTAVTSLPRPEGLIEIVLPDGVTLRVDDRWMVRSVPGSWCAGRAMIALDVRRLPRVRGHRYAQGDGGSVDAGAADPGGGSVRRSGVCLSRTASGVNKLIWHDGVGLCMLTKRLEQGQFAWPSARTTGRIMLSSAQLAALLDGCEWRAPAPRRRPELAG